MQRDLAVYLIDVQQCLEELAVFVKDKTLKDYQRETMLHRAIEREFTIIGEVIRRILHHFPETAARIVHARKIADFRNVIVHEYDLLDDTKIWSIATNDAPVLRLQIDRWLAELDRACRSPMKAKPSWPFFLTWLIVYTVLDMLLEALLHSKFAWNQLPGAIEGALLGATLTWFFALFRWYKAQDRF